MTSFSAGATYIQSSLRFDADMCLKYVQSFHIVVLLFVLFFDVAWAALCLPDSGVEPGCGE